MQYGTNLAKLETNVKKIVPKKWKTALAEAKKDNTEAQAKADPKKPATKNTPIF